jgi:hypothetical protein
MATKDGYFTILLQSELSSQRAEFDERYFPGLKHTPLTPEPFEPPPSVPFTPALDLGGEDEPDTNPTQDNHAPLPASPQIAPAPLEPAPIILKHLLQFLHRLTHQILIHQNSLQPSQLQFVALDAKSGLLLNGGRSGIQPLQWEAILTTLTLNLKTGSS